LCYERAAARAVLSRDRSGVEHALSLHPWVPGSVSISALASRVCAAPPSESVAD
jgi:alpha-galactosidase/6-phospho-beta-glucosidase family protein